MNHFIVFASILSIALAQRPTYAGLSSKGYPELASRFRDPDSEQDQNSTNNVGIGSRLGVDDEQPPQNLPTDARGDSILVNRLNQWPRENRPFWLLNAQHLDQHRRPNDNVNQSQQNVINSDPAILNGNQQGINRDQPTLVGNQQTIASGQTNRGQLQSRFGEPVGTDVRTIRPISQRGSFAGARV